MKNKELKLKNNEIKLKNNKRRKNENPAETSSSIMIIGRNSPEELKN